MHRRRLYYGFSWSENTRRKIYGKEWILCTLVQIQKEHYYTQWNSWDIFLWNSFENLKNWIDGNIHINEYDDDTKLIPIWINKTAHVDKNMYISLQTIIIPPPLDKTLLCI